MFGLAGRGRGYCHVGGFAGEGAEVGRCGRNLKVFFAFHNASCIDRYNLVSMKSLSSRSIFGRSLMALMGLIFLSTVAVSQTTERPNFSGDWRLDRSESKVTKGSDPGAFDISSITTLRVQLSGDKLTVSRIAGNDRVISTSTFQADGKDHDAGDGSTVKTKWEGARLVTQFKPRPQKSETVGARRSDGSVNIGGGGFKREIRFEWDLLPNGKLSHKVASRTRPTSR